MMKDLLGYFILPIGWALGTAGMYTATHAEQSGDFGWFTLVVVVFISLEIWYCKNMTK